MKETPHSCTLHRKGDQVLARTAGQDEEVPVRIVWARPLTGRDSGVCILHATKKTEVALLQSLDDLDAASRGIAEEELASRYFLPKITHVLHTRARFGNRYWHVETDRGPKRFLMKSPETNATWVTEDRCILKDTLGNCYEIESFGKLDPESRAKAEIVL